MSTKQIPGQSRGTSQDARTTVPADRAARPLAVLRIATGLIFLWAFVDKAFGLGYSTASERAWFSGGSPTKGFLGHVAVGPLESTFHGWAGAPWADFLFMIGLFAIGVALVLGVGLRIAAVSTALMMLLMWVAEWPLAQHTSAGEPSGSTNPLIDYHVIYAIVAVVLAYAAAGDTWGLGRRWAKLPFVQANQWLR
ncbi:DoxX family membrane protein [Umezawaea endophytica]|uniref:DoxX family membrane protein n=1 Tax=Umezawaea endophytica TaxID=1654476 RepID=A0A9X2VXX2_9PSEU|nr:DoxX family membrane protein [Umezawaea endophytica]MCS7484730.1 DoxX family membrane protein [Umezawaea endophytica]